ncbi:hypothetical protein PRZ48_014898 [Zasmidium cellare]|uniref:Uncharacterized protein n=1 Tax=Zasmidium cellare TaxID=395010 RepID=A0ABR0DX12_ZASCE|nr:hypothetical protein PRZ48_014898 [Zasmidium cellare]
MAVSLSELSKQNSKRQSMAYATATYMPMPEHFNQTYPQPFPQYSYIPPPPPPPPQQNDSQQLSHPAYYYNQRPSLEEEQVPPPPPPRPPKTPIEPDVEQVPELPPRKRATTIIEPDPLPPHSNPQALTQSQSEAFSTSSPIPPVRIGKEEVWNPQTGFAVFVITREAAHIPNFMSSKPLLTVTRTNGVPMGTVRFHSLTSNSIDLTVNGRGTSISHSGLIHNRWGFQSTTRPNLDERWYWKKDKITGGAKLEDSKKGGHTLAKMKGDLLTFESGHLSEASYDEVLLSAVAMAEAARRQKRKSDIADLGSAIGDFASGDGGSGDGGGDGGGGSSGA